MKDEPNRAVADWLDKQNLRSLYFTTVNLMELHFGVHLLPDGKRKTDLWEVLAFTLAKLFDDRLLRFTPHDAEVTAAIGAETEKRGRKLGTADLQIAGIAKAHGFSVVSRDGKPFIDAGVTLIDPWDAV